MSPLDHACGSARARAHTHTRKCALLGEPPLLAAVRRAKFFMKDVKDDKQMVKKLRAHLMRRQEEEEEADELDD